MIEMDGEIMKKGYYLSCYISVSDIGYVVKEHIRHDQNMALWYYDGIAVSLVHYWELERYTGLKHHMIPFYSIEQVVTVVNELLNEYNLSLNEMEAVWGTPELNDYSKSYQEDMRGLLNRRFSVHSYAHLFSSILSDSQIFYNNDILALEVDGGPDGAYDKGLYCEYLYVGAWIRQGKIIATFPIESPALMWLKLYNLTGLEEGTLMALGSASKCRCKVTLRKDLRVFNYAQAETLNGYIENLYRDIMEVPDECAEIVDINPAFSARENRISAMVKIINELSIDMMERNIQEAINQYGIRPEQTFLALSGGFALNCPINTKIMKQFRKKLLAPPCVNDSGNSLGIGLMAFYSNLDYVSFELKNAYQGKEIKADEIESIKCSDKWKKFIRSIDSIDYEQAVQDIMENPVIWVNGKAEIGPRALGARSLIGDPRQTEMKNKLNQIKQRQWWRPVAPIVLEEQVAEWFENSYPTKYMLNTFGIREEKKKQVPAILHLDNSARVQTLTKHDNEELYCLIKKFYETTGVPIICNTSLNDRGQPIINDLENIIRYALTKRIKVAYVNGLRIEFQLPTDQAFFDETYLYQIDFNIDERLLKKTDEEYLYAEKELKMSGIRNFISNPHIYKGFDIKKDKDVRVVKRMQTMQIWLRQKGRESDEKND